MNSRLDPIPAPPARRWRLWPLLVAAASGGLLAICFPPLDIGGLAFLGLTPLLWVVWKYRPARRRGLFRFLAGWLCGMVYYSISFWWLGELAPLFTPWLVGLPVLIAAALALYPALWAWFAGWLVGGHFDVAPPDPLEPFSRPPLLSSLRNLGIAIVLAAMWTALEWVRGWFLTGFGWDQLGVALCNWLPLIQIAEFTGVGGLTFLLVLCNVMAVITILRVQAEIRRARLRPHFDFAITLSVLVLISYYGVRVLPRNWDEPQGVYGPVLRVAAVQPNIPQPWKFGYDPKDPDATEADMAERIRDITELYHSLAMHGRPARAFRWNLLWPRDVTVMLKPQLVVWPEAALFRGVLGIEENKILVRKLMKTTPALLLGTDDTGLASEGGDHNSAALFLRGGSEMPELYHKMHLVPFGEYLPFRWALGWALSGLCPGDFVPGTETKVMRLPEAGVTIAPLVCFEDTLGELTRKPVLMGAQILVNITNDGWFGKSSEPRHHLNNAIFRAVENRRPLVRCGNTAATCVVDRFGRVEMWSQPFVAYPHDTSDAIHDVHYEVQGELTFYTRYGEVFSMGCAGIAVAVWVVGVIVRRRGRTSNVQRSTSNVQ